MSNNPIFCAIDTSDIDKAKELAISIKPYVGGIKLGLEFFTSCGISGIKQIEDLGLPLFIDLKFYDIPNTVTSALKNILEINPKHHRSKSSFIRARCRTYCKYNI